MKLKEKQTGTILKRLPSITTQFFKAVCIIFLLIAANSLTAQITTFTVEGDWAGNDANGNAVIKWEIEICAGPDGEDGITVAVPSFEADEDTDVSGSGGSLSDEDSPADDDICDGQWGWSGGGGMCSGNDWDVFRPGDYQSSGILADGAYLCPNRCAKYTWTSFSRDYISTDSDYDHYVVASYGVQGGGGANIDFTGGSGPNTDSDDVATNNYEQLIGYSHDIIDGPNFNEFCGNETDDNYAFDMTFAYVVCHHGVSNYVDAWEFIDPSGGDFVVTPDAVTGFSLYNNTIQTLQAQGACVTDFEVTQNGANNYLVLNPAFDGVTDLNMVLPSSTIPPGTAENLTGVEPATSTAGCTPSVPECDSIYLYVEWMPKDEGDMFRKGNEGENCDDSGNLDPDNASNPSDPRKYYPYTDLYGYEPVNGYQNLQTGAGLPTSGPTEVAGEGLDPDPEFGDCSESGWSTCAAGPAEDCESLELTFTYETDIDLAKNVLSVAPNPANPDYFDFTYEIIITNNGDMTLIDPILEDDLAATFGSAAGVVGIAAGPTVDVGVDPAPVIGGGYPTVNPAFDGTGDIQILNGTGGIIEPGEDMRITFTVTIDRSVTGGGTFTNSTTVSATDCLGSVAGADVFCVSQNASVAYELKNPEITLDKSITNSQPAASGVGGNFDVTYEFVIENTGDENLCSVLLQDDLASQYGSAFVGVVTAPTITGGTSPTQGATVGAAYLGNSAGDEMLDGNACLDVGETLIIELVVEIDPDAAGAIYDPITGNLENQATTSGVGDSGETVEDLSDDEGDDADGEDDPTPFSVPAIGLAKDITNIDPAASGISGNYDITYEFVIQNIGTDTLCMISLEDDFATQYGGAFVGITTQPVIIGGTAHIPGTVTTTAYDGSGQPEMLNQDACIAPGETLIVEVVAEVDPNGPGAIFNADGELDNQATTEGTNSDGETVDDDSDDGSDASGGTNPGEDGDEGTSDDPTPLVLPDISLDKAITNTVPASSGVEGNFDVTYEFVIENAGNDTLCSVLLQDNLALQIGGAFVGIVTPPTITGGTSYLPGTASPVPPYAGITTSDEMLTGDGCLASGETLIIELVIEMDPDNPTAIVNPLTGTLDNQGTTSGIGESSGEPVEDDSDDMGDDTDGGLDDPTPFSAPSIGLAKDIVGTAPAASGVSGNYDVTYEFVIQNTGTDTLCMISLEDDFATQYGGAFVGITSQPVITGGTAHVIGTVTTAPYDGSGQPEMLGEDACIATGETIIVQVVVEVDPNGPGAIYNADGELDNQATTEGTNGDGETVDDDSDDGSSPTGTNPGEDGDEGTSDDPTPLLLPAIELDKAITNTVPAASGVEGNFDVTYEFVIENAGNDTLCTVLLQDNLAAQIGGAFQGIVTGPVITGGTSYQLGTTVGAAYTGTATGDEMLSGDGCIAPAETIIVEIVIEMDPDDPGAIYNPITGTLDNQGTTSGVGENSGETVEDDSDDMGDDTDGGVDDPTPFSAPSIGLAKDIVGTAPAASGVTGNYDVTYEFVIQNTGTDTLCMISLEDDFATQYGGAFVGITSQPVITGGTAHVIGTVTAAPYDGSGQPEMLGEDACMATGEIIIVQVVVEVDPNGPGAIYNADGELDNQATTEGTNGDGETVDDDSDDGSSPTGTNPGEDGDEGTSDDPTPLLLPAIELDKAITNTVPAASGVEGNFDVTYEFVIENAGNDTLCTVLLQDNLAAQIGGAFQGIVTGPVITGGTSYQLGTTVGAAYTGTATGDEMLSGDGCIAPAETIIVEIVIEMDPDDPGAIYNPITGTLDNQGTTSGVGENSGETVEDDSDDMGDDTDGGVDDPTPFSVPSIGLAKDIVGTAPAASGIEGNYDVTYEFVIQNTGTDTLCMISLEDDIMAQYGGAFVGVTSQPVITGGTAHVLGTVTAAPYDGGGQPEMLGLDGCIAIGETIIVQLVLEIDPNGPGAIFNADGELENQATTEGTNSDGETAEDDSNDGDDTDGGDEPTPLILPSIGLAKDIVGQVPASSGTEDNWDMTFEFVIENTGNEELCNVTLQDDLASQYGGAFVSVVTQPVITGGTATTPGTVVPCPPCYSGTPVADEMLAGDACLLPGETLIVQVTVEVDPNDPGAFFNFFGALENQGTTSGDGEESGETVEDDSDDGSDPNGDNGSGGTDDPTPAWFPDIDVAKQVDPNNPPVPAASGVQGNYDVTYTFVTMNNGTDSLTNVILQDALVSQIGGAYVGVVTQPVVTFTDAYTVGTANTGYAPDGASDLIVGLWELAPGESIAVTVVIEIDPDNPGAIYDPVSLELENQAYTAGDGVNSGVSDDDESDDGTDASGGDNPGEPGDEGTNDDPTPLSLPSINVVKQISPTTPPVPAASGIVGNFDVTYELQIKNNGNVVLNDVALTDDLVAQYGGAFVGITSQPVITATTTSFAPGAATTTYGPSGDNDLLGAAWTLGICETINVSFVAEIDFDSPTAIYNADGELDNQATTEGTTDDGTTVEDDSDDGADNTSDNPGEPGDEGTYDDPTPLIVPDIHLAKYISTDNPPVPAASGIQGNFDVTYEFIVKSTGNDTLQNITLEDDVAAQYGAAYVGVVTQPALIATNAPVVGSLSTTFGPSGDNTLLLPGSGWILGPCDTIHLSVVLEIDPDAPGAIYDPVSLELENQATTTGDGVSSGTTVDDESDDGTDANGTNPDSPGDEGTEDDPTPLSLPAINVVKTISTATPPTPSASGVVGNYDITYELQIKNTGNVVLNDVSLVDDMLAQYGGAFVGVVSQPVITATTTTFAPGMPTTTYGPSGDNDLLGAGWTLGICETINVSFVAEIDLDNPTAIYNADGELDNQATTEGTTDDGTTVDDISDDGTDNTTDNPGEPGDEGTYDDPTPLIIPEIHLAKRVSVDNPPVPATSGTLDNFDVTYEFVIKSTGNDTLENVSLMDDIAAQFGGAFIGIVTQPTLIATNASTVGVLSTTYGPSGDNFMINPTDGWVLGPCDTIHLSIVVEIDPDGPGAIYTPDGELENQAETAGDGQVGGPVDDLSDDGADPNSDNPGSPGDHGTNDDPTPLSFPMIRLAKDISNISVPAASGVSGNADVTFTLVIENTGTTNLSDIYLTDDLSAQLGSAFVGITAPPVIIASTANVDPAINAAFTGVTPGDDILMGGGNMDPNQQITVEIYVELDPNAAGAPDPLENQATTTAEDPNGGTVEDESDSGTDPEGDNPGEPGDEGTPDDPTEIRIPNISLVKSLVGYAPPASGISGHVDIIMDLDLKNIGNVELKQLNLIDQLDDPANFGIWYVGLSPGSMPTITSSDATADPVLDPTYDGFTGSNENMFDGMSGCLDVNQHVTVQIVLTLDATIPGIPDTLYNQATVDGSYTDPNDGSVTTVDDDSDSGTMHESTNPGEPGDMGTEEDPTPIPLLGCVGNMVWNDCNGNGVMDPGEDGIEGVTIYLKDAAGMIVNVTTTDADGKYEFEYIIPGDYYLEFTAPTGWDFTFPDSGGDDTADSDVTGALGVGTTDLFYVQAGVQCEDNDFYDAGLYQCVLIGDLVWYDTNENNLYDNVENGINGLQVNLYRKNNNTGVFELYDQTHTGHKPNTPSDDGWYKFCAAPGTYYVEIGTPLNGLVLSQPDVGNDEEIDSDLDAYYGPNTSDDFTVVCGAPKCDLGAGFYLMATAGDRVWRDDNSNGKQESFEPRIAGVTVEVYDNTGTKVDEDVTDSNGDYHIDYLQEEDYYFKVLPPSGYGITDPDVGGDDSIDSDINGSNGPGTSDFYTMESGEHQPNIDIGLILGGSLPVSYLEYQGKQNGDHNLITWKTTNEVNNSHFDIERQFGASQFTKIGRLEGFGTTSSTKDYQFEDYDISKPGVYYYRLRQVDYNGNEDLSGVIAIVVKDPNRAKSVGIYPNPVLSDLNLQLSTQNHIGDISIELFDATGKLVMTEELSIHDQSEFVQHTMDVGKLSEGVYNISIKIGAETISRQFIKVR